MGELATPLKIRSHHLLCVLGFSGLGYSQKFIATMEEVAKRMRFNPTFPITVVAECDIICASCPHNKENKCLKETESELKVKTRDLELLLRLGLEAGTQILADEALMRIKERLSFEDMAEICRDCEWLELGYCVQGLEKLKQVKSGQKRAV